MASADRRPDTVRAALTAAGRAVYGALLGVRDAAVRFLRWVARWWRASLQFRVVTTTILLSLVMMGLLEVFLYQRIADGLVQDRIATARVQSVASTRAVQERLDNIEQTDPETIRQRVYDTIRQEAAARGDESRHVILIRALRNNSTQLVLPAMDTGLDAGIVPQDIRDALAADPTHQQRKVIRIPAGERTLPTVLIGTLVSVPDAGQYELYFVYPLERQEQILNMVRGTFLLGVVVFAALIGLVAHVVTRLAVDPVREAAVVAQRLAKGRFNERLIVKGQDDLAKLGTAFNAMADTLQAQIGRLEDMSAVQQRFVSDVSHELRTPLTTIRMAAEVIYDEREEFGPVPRRSAEILHAEVDRFDLLLADLLEISRFDAGAANLDRQKVDVRDVVDRVLAASVELARHKGSSVELVGPDEPLKAELDPRRVERIVRNIVVNALEHGEGTPIRVELGGNDEAVAVAVRDHGIGLQPGQADLVFTRFWRADPARKRTTGGTGLGLAIALEDARLHDGWLQAWGTPGDGCRFRLTLPRVAGRPIGYSPLPLADPPPEEFDREGATPVGEPITAAGAPARATAETVGVVAPPAPVEPVRDPAGETDVERAPELTTTKGATTEGAATKGTAKKGTATKGTATKGTAKKGTATKGQAAESVDDDAGTRADPTRRTGPADREDLPPMDASPQPDVGGEPVRASGAGALDAPPPPGRS